METTAVDIIPMASTLFFVLNATGQIPLFLALLGRFDHKRQLRIITREMLIALGLLFLFTFAGDEVLQILGISRHIIGMAGGVLLFLISLTMIFPKSSGPTEELRSEPVVIPLAIPVITGPGAITTVMLFAHNTGNPWKVATAAFLAWVPSLLILLAGSLIKRILGEKGLVAVERLGGMIVCLIGIQILTRSLFEYIQLFYKIGA